MRRFNIMNDENSFRWCSDCGRWIEDVCEHENEPLKITPARKRSKRKIRAKLGLEIATAHPDWSIAKVEAQLALAAIGLGQYARRLIELVEGKK